MFLKAERKVRFGSEVWPSQDSITLQHQTAGSRPYNSFASKEAMVSWFGWNNDKETYSSGKLLKAKAKIVPNDHCQRKFTSPIQDSQLCANIVEHDKDVIQGVCIVSIKPWHLLSCCSNNIVKIWNQIMIDFCLNYRVTLAVHSLARASLSVSSVTIQ